MIPEPLPLFPLQALQNLCECKQLSNRKEWRHFATCKVWIQLLPSVSFLIFQESTYEKWNALATLFKAPYGEGIPPPQVAPEVWTVPDAKEGQRHPLFKSYVLIYGNLDRRASCRERV